VILVASAFTEKETIRAVARCGKFSRREGPKSCSRLQGERINVICPQRSSIPSGCRTQAPTRREQLTLTVTRPGITDVGLVINEARDHLHSQRSGSNTLVPANRGGASRLRSLTNRRRPAPVRVADDEAARYLVGAPRWGKAAWSVCRGGNLPPARSGHRRAVDNGPLTIPGAKRLR
jgi:hypothetical protein